MTDEERAAEYEICKRRGHQPDDLQYISMPPKSRCKWCGVTYWTETVLHEGPAPVDIAWQPS